MIISDFEFDINHSKTIQISNVKISSASKFNKNILDKDFWIEHTFDKLNNQISLAIPKLENQPFLEGQAVVQEIDK